jgi:hypothetical protein
MNKTSAKSEKKMSTVADRPTIGQMLVDTQEEYQKQQIEVGEFVDEVGNKEVMAEIWRQIDARKGLPQWLDKWYLLVLFKKDAILHRVINVFVQSRHTRPDMEPGFTCFSYNPKEGQLLLEWVLPNKHAFKTFLKTRDYTDGFLMHCIDTYLAGKENHTPYRQI